LITNPHRIEHNDGIPLNPIPINLLGISINYGSGIIVEDVEFIDGEVVF